MALTALSQSARSESLNSFSVLTGTCASSLSQNRCVCQRAGEWQFMPVPDLVVYSRLYKLQLRLLRFRHPLRRFSSAPLWFCLSAAGTFQMGKNFFGAIEDFFGQAGETGHLDTVTFVSATRDDFAQK